MTSPSELMYAVLEGSLIFGVVHAEHQGQWLLAISCGSAAAWLFKVWIREE